MSSRTDDVIGSLAVERRLLTPEQLAEVLAARGPDHSLGQLLLARNLLTPSQLVEITAIALERATQTVTPRTRTPRAAASDPTTARAVNELASDDKYELRGQIAEGGMGRILKAYDKRLRRNVAMKVIRTEHGLTADDLARFSSRIARGPGRCCGGVEVPAEAFLGYAWGAGAFGGRLETPRR